MFLGFILDSVLMQVRLTPEKACKLKEAATHLLRVSSPSIREVAIVLGLIVSSFPGLSKVRSPVNTKEKKTCRVNHKWQQNRYLYKIKIVQSVYFVSFNNPLFVR